MQLQNKRETESRAQKNHLKRGENTEILLERTTISERWPKEERESERQLKAQQEHAENSRVTLSEREMEAKDQQRTSKLKAN